MPSRVESLNRLFYRAREALSSKFSKKVYEVKARFSCNLSQIFLEATIGQKNA
jgi:hypothetical protein